MAEKLSITLPAEMVAAIRQRVDSGSFSSTSEVLRTAMRSWLRQEEEYEERMAAIRAKIARSVDDPRPRLSSHEMRAHLDALYARHEDAE